jgi:molybdopterin biosynthesis enzyme MoaB
VKGELGGDLLRPEGTGVFFFIHQFDSSHPHITVIEVKVLGVVDGVSDLDSVSDIGRGDLIKATFEADGGIVIDYSFIADEEDLIQLRLGESSDGHSVDRGIVAIHRSFSDAGMQLVVVVVLEP